ncbi:TPA: CpaF family protein [Vibrio parahaemolyticus]|uniref:CpaF family protein n=1 Tax=Vibrio parahaemolyticus TaxID=670 RepID=UPI00041FB41F|nr:CpaF family protein [Vibrio parahaemolyticus]APC89651.1 Type II/IV secretion system ATP hydrolase TadA/VirB11/CpaF, TadA subfamily [Vibrio parahaemolyticus]EJC7035014.1 CpaF family protein [Vibrio parahaemolyticus]ELB2129739.1 CpaF family protein [Vibrio parahaemolyticus]ELB2142683.1 CpaF family protein [Vibrio parahaemolyticus]ELB2237225.1 CpaF family protein [Vibrio parahaemolyticus]
MSSNKDLYLTFRGQIFEALDAEAVQKMSRRDLEAQIQAAVDLLANSYQRPITSMMKSGLVKSLIDELFGLGPLQPLVEDQSISDIMVNGPNNIFFERYGKVQKSEVSFVNEEQLLAIAKRIASRVGRRVDELSPTVDARLEDGSRVNIVIPPIALDGTSISIRKFREQNIGFEDLIGFGTMSPDMARVLMIASRCRMNVLISGGTGSGKTTLLNALSQYIAEDERIVTIEDAAELRLQQPNLVRLETRTSSIEQTGAVTQRDLVINALRMRPDRIILGECRGSEAFEMLQAMNTGHDGSMSTLHANTPRDAIARVESMVMMANLNQPLDAIRRTIVSAVQMIVQVNRLRDGSRKITSISEIVGLEGDSVVMEEIYRFRYDDAHFGETVKGDFVTSGIMQRSELVKKSHFFGLYDELMGSFKGT